MNNEMNNNLPPEWCTFMNTEDISDIHDTLLRRTDQRTEEYEKHKAELAQNNRNVEDHIRAEIFDQSPHMYQLVKNKFPYGFVDNSLEWPEYEVVHYLLWGNPDVMLHEDIDSITEFAYRLSSHEFEDAVEFRCFQNPPRLRSIGGLPHVHVIALYRKEDVPSD
jgi:hypothetical protein